MKPALSCLVVFLAAAGSVAVARDAPAVSIPGTYQHDLRSGPDGTEYRLFVGLPPGYDAGGTARYPVAYILDGNVVFPFAITAQRMFALFGDVPDLIVVGVGYPVRFFPETIGMRWNDLTPMRNPAADAEQSARFGMQLQSGGGAEFLRFLREDAIPFVEGKYRTTDDRAIWGHSLGGLFTLYALFEAPDLFRRYGVSSPSLQLNSERMFQREAAYADRQESLPARVFISLGSEENDISMHAAQLVDVLRKREYEGLAVESHVFRNETHVSVFPAAFSRGMRFLYASEAAGSRDRSSAAE